MEVRILQMESDTDNIRIGATKTISDKDLDLFGEKVMETYKMHLSWTGTSADEAIRRFYSKISIVDANTLVTIKMLYENN